MERDVRDRAREVIRRCLSLAAYSEEPGFTTRTFLSEPMRAVHRDLSAWMTQTGMRVHIDAAGNLRGVYPGSTPNGARLFIGSHLDTVPRAGAFDGILGVVTGVALVELLDGRVLPFSIEVVGFSDEEGVRFGAPFIGSRALAGTTNRELLEQRDKAGHSVGDAIRMYGLDPAGIDDARAAGDAIGYVELHIEQGPLLERLGLPLGIVDVIAGQSRVDVLFTGAARHAGTTPMGERRDAVACAAEWIGRVEGDAVNTPGLVATVGQIEALPGAGNVIAGLCRTSLDVRHADDSIRKAAVDLMRGGALAIASRRGLHVRWTPRLDQPAVHMTPSLVAALTRGVQRSGAPVYVMSSGAGHDAMVLAQRMPVAMLLLRSPGGVSHHPDESVEDGDVAAALAAGLEFLDEIASTAGG